jgi:hypothetical protein
VNLILEVASEVSKIKLISERETISTDNSSRSRTKEVEQKQNSTKIQLKLASSRKK